ncbi:hypothetical protein NKH98_07490 [Mesorhizobium sp. M0833]|uniref:hypothetical protein n=1 Tax=Mesorhizobium sp. M0833 TaxID=2957009 RepID=UPI00333AD062
MSESPELRSPNVVPLDVNQLPVPDFHTLVREYEIADELCKEVQHFRSAAGIPAINELRYAGYHYINACRSGGTSPAPTEMIKAVNHCRRATYEAAEAGILMALDEIRSFRTDYKTIVVSEVVPNWPVILTEAQGAVEHLRKSREHGDDRKSDYTRHRDLFRTLKSHCDLLESSRDDLNNKIRGGIRETRRFLLNSGLTVLGIAVAVVLGILAL